MLILSVCAFIKNMSQAHLRAIPKRTIRVVIWLVCAITTLSAHAQGDGTRKQPQSPYTEECITEQKIIRENNWTRRDQLARYEGSDAHLFAETVSPEVARDWPAYPFDKVIVWGGPNVWGGAVALLFKDGCAINHWFVGDDYRHGASVVEEYRKSGSADFDKFLSTPKRNYYQAERYFADGKYVEAEPLYFEALKEFKKHGQYGSSVNMTLHRIALLNEAIKKFDIAEKYYHLAMAGWRANGSAQEAEVRRDLANMLRSIGRHTEADAIDC
jgi:tetratricopeptide (TPR) repeat protein